MRRVFSKISRRIFPPAQVIDGYESQELVDVIVRKTEAYAPSEFIEVGAAQSVLDFGGGSGRHYKEAGSPKIKWAVVETPKMVATASRLETEHLKFFTDIDGAVSWLGAVDLMYSNGAIQYTPNPLQYVEKLATIGAREVHWHRLYLSDDQKHEDQTSFLSDNGPGDISMSEKLVRYRRQAISENAFLIAHARYRLVRNGSDWFVFRV